MKRELELRNERRKRRKQRVRKKLRGSKERPRLSVSKSLKHLSCQIIDDERGVTLVSFGTQAKGAKEKKKGMESARSIGKKIAELAKQKEITRVIFDRGRFKYHGIIAEIAKGAREEGLTF